MQRERMRVAVAIVAALIGLLASPAAGAPTAGELIAGQWRLLSLVFPMLPPGGYPIAFRQDGAAETANLAGVTGWSMRGTRLELTGGGRVLYAFEWSDRHGAFRHHVAGGAAAGLAMIIVPAGLDPQRADAAMQERDRREVDPAVLPPLAAPPSPPVTLRGAKVSTEDDASSVAIRAYFSRAGGMRALESVRVMGVASLGFEMPDFAGAGDRVWEVRVYELGSLRAVIWINAETGRARFLAP